MTNIDLNIWLCRLFSAAAIAFATTEVLVVARQLKVFGAKAREAQRYDLAGDAAQMRRTLVHELINRRSYAQRTQ